MNPYDPVGKRASVAVVYLPELMDPILVDPEKSFEEQVPEPYRARVRLVMAYGGGEGFE